MAGFCKTACSMKRFAVILFCYWSLQWTETDLAGAFFRTLVTCEPPVPNKEMCPGGSFYEQDRCVPKPPGDVDWSGSAHCMDKAFVVTEATAFRGSFSAFTLVANICPSVFIANTLLDKIGRKKVMLIGFVSFVAFNSCYTLSVQYGKMLIVVGGLIVGIFDAFQTAQIAMAADLAARDEGSVAVQMGTVSAFENLGVVIGVTGGFFVLRLDLTDYTYVWATFTVLAFLFVLLCAFVLKESFVPAEGVQTFSCRRHCLMTCHELAFSVSQIRRDKFLICTFVPMFLVIFAICGITAIGSAWAIGVCGYSQAVASLAGVLQPICIAISGMNMSLSVRIFGSYHICGVACLIVAAGMVICGLGGVARDFEGGEYGQQLAGICFWCGWAILGFGLGQLSPSFQALISLRVPENFQGRLFAVQSLLLLVATAGGGWFGSNVLLKLEVAGAGSASVSTGRLVLPWTINAAACVVAFLMLCRLRKAHKITSPLLVDALIPCQSSLDGQSLQAPRPQSSLPA